MYEFIMRGPLFPEIIIYKDYHFNKLLYVIQNILTQNNAGIETILAV